MNVLILPTDDRLGQLTFIDLYSRLGHRVYIPKKGTLGLDWHRIATWPALLCNSHSGKRNLTIHGYDLVSGFGEDTMLGLHEFNESCDHPTSCEIVDLSQEKIDFDIVQTLRGVESSCNEYMNIFKAHCPHAVWSTASFNPYISYGTHARNISKIIPAPYDEIYPERNNVKLMCSDLDMHVLGVHETVIEDKVGFASFNHNFAVRQPDDWKLFNEMNSLLPEGIRAVNYGGNIRGMGADTRYSEDDGITGKFSTLTPREAILKAKGCKAIVHFKQTDWGGGVPQMSINACIPMITTERYLVRSGADRFFKHMSNCVVVNTPGEAATAVMALENDAGLRQYLTNGLVLLRASIFDTDYYQRWREYVEKMS